VQPLHVGALVVGLKAAHLQAERVPLLLDHGIELGERQRPVERRVAVAELVEVDAVQHLDDGPLGAHRASSSTAARSASGETACPSLTSPGAFTSTNGTSAPVRFLSRATASITDSTSTSSRRTGSPLAASSSLACARSSSCPLRRRAASRPSPTASPCR